MELDEVKDAYRALESSLSREDQRYKQKCLLQEKSMEQLNSMYQSVVSERSVLRIDLSTAEKKLKRKDDKIFELEKIVGEKNERLGKYETIIKYLREEFIKLEKKSKESSSQIGSQMVSNKQTVLIGANGALTNEAKVVKAIRGGGAKKIIGGGVG